MSIVKWKIKKIKLADVKLRPDNPRIISKNALEGLRNSISRFGCVEPIVWNKTTGNIVGGHQRYYLLAKAGVVEANMMVVDMSPEEEMAANLTLNNPEIEGRFTENTSDLLHQVETGNAELFNSLHMDALLSSLENIPKIVGEDKAPVKETDTRCPCCGYKWKIDAKDVILVNQGKEEL
jgi:ParB-like chromosome segregation protein Spo0J